jgi:hypothetical protein
MNKYPGGQVRESGESLDVWNKDGEHVIAIRKNGAGQLVDCSEEMGLRDRHDLAPIPKQARCYKMVDGKVSRDDQYEARLEERKKYLCPEKKDVVLSCAELEKKYGKRFDEKQKELA